MGDSLFGAGSGGRTRTLSPGLDFESSTSANSIIPAHNVGIIAHIKVKCQARFIFFMRFLSVFLFQQALATYAIRFFKDIGTF